MFLWQCGNLEGMIQRFYDSIAATYDSAYSTAQDRAEDQFVLSKLASGGLLEGRILDLGCGTGWLLDHVRLSPSLM